MPRALRVFPVEGVAFTTCAPEPIATESFVPACASYPSAIVLSILEFAPASAFTPIAIEFFPVALASSVCGVVVSPAGNSTDIAISLSAAVGVGVAVAA